MKHLSYTLIRILNWLIVLSAALETINLCAYIGDRQEIQSNIPDTFTLLVIATFGIYILGMIPLWFYPRSRVTTLQKRIGYVLAVVGTSFFLLFAGLFWHYRQDGIPFNLTLPLMAPFLINGIGLLAIRLTPKEKI